MFVTMDTINGDVLAAARARLMAALARQSAFWGVGRTPGAIYAALYLAGAPMALGELAEAVGVSKPNVSIAVRVLEDLGMVWRWQRPGDRRVFFEAEADFWRIARRVLERRQRPAFDESFRMVAESAALAAQAPPGADRDLVLARIAALQAFYRQLDAIVAALLRLGPQRWPQLLRRLLGGARGRSGA
jgi:DNA-binding transcriptional regulator GbsR (MarR family)